MSSLCTRGFVIAPLQSTRGPRQCACRVVAAIGEDLLDRGERTGMVHRQMVTNCAMAQNLFAESPSDEKVEDIHREIMLALDKGAIDALGCDFHLPHSGLVEPEDVLSPAWIGEIGALRLRMQDTGIAYGEIGRSHHQMRRLALSARHHKK